MKLVIILEVPVLNLGLVYCYSCRLKARIKLVRAPEGEFLALAFLSSQDGKNTALCRRRRLTVCCGSLEGKNCTRESVQC